MYTVMVIVRISHNRETICADRNPKVLSGVALTWINQLSEKKMCKLLIWLLICMA